MPTSARCGRRTGTLSERRKDLASQAAADNVDSAGRTRINTEFQLLIAEIDRIAVSTEFSGVVLLNGTASDLEFVVGNSSAIANDKITLTASTIDLDATALGVAGTAVDTDTGAEAVLTQLDAATTGSFDLIGNAFATVGAQANRLDVALNQVRITVENTAAAESVIRDADMAAEITELTKNQILAQAGISVLAQANSSSQSVLALLQ